MSSETIQLASTLATLAVVAIGVTFAAVHVHQGVLARRLQNKLAFFSEIWQEEGCGPRLAWDHIPTTRTSRHSIIRP